MSFLRVVCLLLPVAVAWAQTRPATVSNAAGGWLGLPLNAVAPGSIISVQITPSGPVVVNPDPSKMSVRITPQNAPPEDAPILRVSIGTVWALAPKDLPLGPAQVVVVSDGQAGPAALVTIVPAAVGVFAQDPIGIGPALAQNDSPSAPPVLNQLTNPARPGDYITLWATGLGQSIPGDVTVEVGGRAVTPAYAGAAPGYAGLDQINIPLPADTPDGCYVSVRVKAGASVSNVVSIAKASAPGACAHPFGLTAAELQALDAGQSVRLGTLTIRSSVEPAASSLGSAPGTYTRNELATVEMAMRSATDVAVLAQPQTADDAYFTCGLTSPVAIARFINVNGGDAGSPLTLLGPGKSLSLPAQSLGGIYNGLVTPPDAVADPAQLPAAFFVPGAWQLTAPGGANIGPFQVSAPLPPLVRWSNRAALAAIDRTVDQTVVWQADGYTANDVMTVSLSSGYFPQSLPAGAMAAGVICRAPASAGKLTIPAALMRQIPPSPAAPLAQNGTLLLQVAPRPDRRMPFDLPLVAGGSARGLFDYQRGETLRTAIR